MGKQRGSFALIMVFSCLGFLALGGLVYYISTTFSPSNQAQTKDPKEFFQSYKTRVENALQSQDAIQVSIDRNPNQFGCFYSNSGSCRGKGGSFLLFEIQNNGENALSHLIKNTGLSLEETSCNPFPSKECPFRIEAKWQPVCGGQACENTKSMKVFVSLRFDDGVSAPMQWSTDKFLEPRIILSASASCARQGGIYNGNDCLTGSAVERIPASDPRDNGAHGNEDIRNERSRDQQEIPQQAETFICPETIVVQGMETIPYIDAMGKARVEVPASNACPNAFDTFIFQCGPVNPQTYANEGQWVQTEAILAPACDDRGFPVDQNGQEYTR